MIAASFTHSASLGEGDCFFLSATAGFELQPHAACSSPWLTPDAQAMSVIASTRNLAVDVLTGATTVGNLSASSLRSSERLPPDPKDAEAQLAPHRQCSTDAWRTGLPSDSSSLFLGTALTLGRPIAVVQRLGSQYLDPVRIYGARDASGSLCLNPQGRPSADPPDSPPTFVNFSFTDFVGLLHSSPRSLSVVEWNGSNHFTPWISSLAPPASVRISADRNALSALRFAVSERTPSGKRPMLPPSAKSRLAELNRLLHIFHTSADGTAQLQAAKSLVTLPPPHQPHPFGRTKYVSKNGCVNTLLRTNPVARTFLFGAHYHELDLKRAHISIAAHTYRLVRPHATNLTCDQLLDPTKLAQLESSLQEELTRSQSRLQADLEQARLASVSSNNRSASVLAKHHSKSLMSPKQAFSAMLNAPTDATWADAFPQAHAPTVWRVNRDIRSFLQTLPQHPHLWSFAHALLSPAGIAAQPKKLQKKHPNHTLSCCLHELEDLAITATRSYLTTHNISTSISVNDSLYISASDCLSVPGGLHSLDPTPSIRAALGFPLDFHICLNLQASDATSPPSAADVMEAIFSPAADTPPDPSSDSAVDDDRPLSASPPSSSPPPPLPHIPDHVPATPPPPSPSSGLPAPVPPSARPYPSVTCPCPGCESLDFGPSDSPDVWHTQKQHLVAKHSRDSSSTGVDAKAALAAGLAPCPCCSKLLNFVALGGPRQPRSQFVVHCARDAGVSSSSSGCGPNLPPRFKVSDHIRKLQSLTPLDSAAGAWLSLTCPACPHATPSDATDAAIKAISTPAYSSTSPPAYTSRPNDKKAASPRPSPRRL